MSFIVKGNLPEGRVLKRTEVVRDPVTGLQAEQEYIGLKAAISALEGQQPPTSTTRIVEETSPVSSLVVRHANGGVIEPEEGVDRWEIDTEPLDQDGFNHPTVQAEMLAYSIPADYRKQIEDAVENGRSSPAVAATNPGAAAIFVELLRGATHFETEFIVLRRIRAISTAYTPKIILNANRYIYSLAQLPVTNILAWTLPGATGNDLPPNPEQAQWGYRLRTQRTVITGIRAEVIHEWVLAAWSTLYYTVSTVNFE